MDREIKRRKWGLKRISALVASAALVCAVVWSLVVEGNGSSLRVPVEHILISTVERGEFQEFVPLTATVVPIRTHYLDATEGGRVEAVYREAGSYVDAGDEILKLANTGLLLDVMYREAELFEQSNNLRNTKITMDQTRLRMRRELLENSRQIERQTRTRDNLVELVEGDLVSRQDYEEAVEELNYLIEKRELLLATQEQETIFREAQVSQLEESLDRMQSNLQIVKQNMENLVIRAPVSGHLTALNADVGQSKGRGERLGQIDVLDGFKLRAAIDEYYITRVEPGLRGTLTFAETTYPLEVLKVYPQVVQGRFEVDLGFDGEEPGGIRRGQTFRLRLELGDPSEAILLPNAGFYQFTGGRWVYLLDESGNEAGKREIVLGRRNANHCEVLSGLEPGDRVVTSSYEFFGDADRLVLHR
jgi:HlyD family secretion protein